MVAWLLLLTLTWMVPVNVDASSTSVAAEPINCNRLSDIGRAEERKCVVRFINSKRKDRDRQPLKRMDTLDWGAQDHSMHMADVGSLIHSRDLARQMNQRVGAGNWELVGENVGVIAADKRRPFDRLMRAFMQSDDHRKNMLRPRYNRIGVGSLVQNGSWWVTIWFVDVA